MANRRRRYDRMVRLFQSVTIDDFNVDSEPIGRGSNGLVFKGQIKHGSSITKQDKAMKGRVFALKRRLLYTNKVSFHAEMNIPFRYPHNNVLRVYGHFKGPIIAPDDIESDHITGKDRFQQPPPAMINDDHGNVVLLSPQTDVHNSNGNSNSNSNNNNCHDGNGRDAEVEYVVMDLANCGDLAKRCSRNQQKHGGGV